MDVVPRENLEEPLSYDNQGAIITEEGNTITIEKTGYYYSANDIKKGHIYRRFAQMESNDFLPDAVEFMNVWDDPKPRGTFSFKITNDNTEGIIALGASAGVLFRNELVVIQPGQTVTVLCCVFNLQPKLIGTVIDDRVEKQ